MGYIFASDRRQFALNNLEKKFLLLGENLTGILCFCGITNNYQFQF